MNKTHSTAISAILQVVFILIISSLPYTVIGKDKIDGAGTPQLDDIFTQLTTTVYLLNGTELNYNSTADLSTLDNLLDQKIDFLTIRDSDTPLELDSETFFQFPLVLSAVVPVVNLPQILVPQLKLDGLILGNIIVGNISRWNDPTIWSYDPGILLQDLPITIVRQDPASATTKTFIEYLELNSPEWMVDQAQSPTSGLPRGLEADSEMDAVLKMKRIPGSIGYISYPFFSGSTLTPISLMDYTGLFSTPNEQSIRRAADRIAWSIGSIVYSPMEAGMTENPWPLTVAYRAIILREYQDRDKGRAIIALFDWFFNEQEGESAALANMVTLSSSVISMIRAEWTTSILCDGLPIWP